MASTAPTQGHRHRSIRRPSEDVLFGIIRPRTLSGFPRAGLLVGLVVVGTAIALLRTPRSMWNLLWAEDGAIFVSGALSDGPGVVLTGYAGYLHLVPRLAAEIAVLFPLQVVPLAVTVLAAGIASLLACACFVFLETRIASLPLRFAVWIVCLALPTMAGDVANNLANLHWYLLVAAFCALLSRSRSAAFTVVQCVVVFAAATSSAIALLLIPFALVRWWLVPGRRSLAVSVAYLAGASLQFVTVLNGVLGTGPAREIAAQYPSFAQLLDLYVNRVVVAGLFGLTGAETMRDAVGAALPGILLAGVVLAVIFAARADRDRRLGIVVFAGSSGVFAGFVYSLQWYAIEQTPATDLLVGLRYAVVPTALLLLALLQCVDTGASRIRRPSVRRGVAFVALIAVLIPVGIDYRSTIAREAPSWSDALTYGEEQCGAGEDDSGIVTVSTAPIWFGGMLMPCSAFGAATD